MTTLNISTADLQEIDSELMLLGEHVQVVYSSFDDSVELGCSDCSSSCSGDCDGSCSEFCSGCEGELQ